MSIRVFQRPKERIQVLLRRQPLSKMGQRCASGPFQRVRGGSRVEYEDLADEVPAQDSGLVAAA